MPQCCRQAVPHTSKSLQLLLRNLDGKVRRECRSDTLLMRQIFDNGQYRKWTCMRRQENWCKTAHESCSRASQLWRRTKNTFDAYVGDNGILICRVDSIKPRATTICHDQRSSTWRFQYTFDLDITRIFGFQEVRWIADSNNRQLEIKGVNRRQKARNLG